MVRTSGGACFAIVVLGLASSASAQGAPTVPFKERWSVDFGIGFDNGISGNINSGAIGELNNQAAVFLRNTYEDVYGTGLHIRFGGGYEWREQTELRVTFTFQSLDAELTQMGEIGAGTLYGQYDDYQSFGMDFGYRRYMPFRRGISGYGEATIGLAFISETDVVLSAPATDFIETATDFYDATAAFTFAINVGVMFELRPQWDAFAQLGLRFVSGMSDVDQLQGTDLETINDNSSRWAIPLTVGIRYRFKF